MSLVDTLLGALSPAQRAGYPIVQRGVNEGLSANAIGRALAAGGIAIRRSTMLDLVNAEKVLQQRGTELKFLPKSKTIDPSRLPEALTKIRRPYSFTVLVRGTLVDTGLHWEQNVTVSTGVLLSPEQIQSLAEQAAIDAKGRYEMEVESSVIVGGKRAGALGTL